MPMSIIVRESTYWKKVTGYVVHCTEQFIEYKRANLTRLGGSGVESRMGDLRFEMCLYTISFLFIFEGTRT